jgi:anti-sigma regulatory factor (Ser/Thr protein kinase)
MREIALHLLDIAENSVAAQARSVEIAVCEDLHADRLSTRVCDDGQGMHPELLARVEDPFVTSRTTRKVGLGIPLFKEAAESCNGGLKITSHPGQGTCVEAWFQRSHIDRMPLGDLAGTLLTLVVAYPPIHWKFSYRAVLPDGLSQPEFVFDDLPFKEAVGGLSISEPFVLEYLKSVLGEGIASVADQITQSVIAAPKSA